MATRIKLRRDSASNWALQNPILALGEPGVVLGTNQIKIGDGATHWADLPYAAAGDLEITGTDIHNDAQIGLSTGRGVSSEWVGKVIPPDAINTYNNGTTTDSVAYDSQGNAYISGWYWSDQGAWLIKVDPTGQELYRLFFNQYNAYGWSMVVDNDDNFYMLLEETDVSNNEIAIAKFSGEDGGIIWSKSIRDGSTNTFASCLDVDSQNNVVIAGATYNANSFYVAKLSGNNGAKIWDKEIYDYAGSGMELYGIKVDANNDIGLVGNRYNGATEAQILKLSGDNGNVMWDRMIGYVNLIEIDNTDWNSAGADIAVDSDGSFYALYSWERTYDGDPLMIVVLAKYDTDGLHQWSKQIGEQWYDNLAGSIAVDSDDYIYVTAQLHKNNDAVNGSSQFNLITVKFDKRGNVEWQRSLQKEQNSTYTNKKPYDYPDWSLGGQLIAVNDTHVLIGGGQYENRRYTDSNDKNDVQGWAAQVTKDGREWEKDGWKFSSLNEKIKSVTTQVVDYAPIDWGNANLEFNNGDVYNEPLYYNWSPIATNDPLTHTATFKDGTFTVEGNLGVDRKTVGLITQIGWFEGVDKHNPNGNVVSNGVARDAAGNTYLAMSWYDNQYNIYNANVPFLSKVLPDGTVAWQATTQQIEFDSDIAISVAVDPSNNQPVLLSDDGSGGFRLTWFDADTGNVKKVTEVTDVADQLANHNLYPYQLKFKADGTPVVVGSKGNNYNQISDITNSSRGYTGSTNGVLIVANDKFTAGFPNESYDWNVYSDSNNEASTYIDAGIYGVNRYTDLPTAAYQPGAGAILTITVNGGAYTAVPNIQNGGARYHVGNQLLIDGAGFPSGVTITNDAIVTVDAVDANGVITAASVTGVAASTDGDYAGMGTTIVSGTGATVRIQINPETGLYRYPQVVSGGSGYVIGDKLKVLGSNIASGIDGTNDLIIEISDIDVTAAYEYTLVSGTGNNEYVKLEVDTSYDFGAYAGDYDVYHYTGQDGFIWTPDWSKVLQGPDHNSNQDYLTSVTIDSEGNIIVGGESQSDGQNYRTLVAKFDSDGNKIWSKYVDDANQWYQTVYGVVTNADNEIFVSSDGNGNGAYITKLGSDGGELWQLRFDGTEGGWQGLDIDDDGSVIIGGSGYNANYGYGPDYFLAKVSTNGNVEWQHYLRSSYGDYNSYNYNIPGVVSVSGGKVAITGYSYSPGDNGYQTVLAVLPSDGTGATDDQRYDEQMVSQAAGAWRYFKAQNNVYYDIGNVGDKYITVNDVVLNSTSYIGADAPMSVFMDRQTLVFPIKETQGAEVRGVAKIIFEDGTTQSTSAQDLPQVDYNLTQNIYWYSVGLQDRGKHIYKNYGGIYIPTNEQVAFPIGSVLTIVNGDSGNEVYLEPRNNSITRIIGTGGVDNSSYSQYRISAKSIVTLLKVEQDKWVLSGGTFLVW